MESQLVSKFKHKSERSHAILIYYCLLCIFGFKTNYGILYPDLRCLLCGEIIKAM